MHSYNTTRRLVAPASTDPILTVVTVLLVFFSLVVVYSTTGVVSQERYGDSLFFVRGQFGAAFVGLVAMYICSRLNLELLRKAAPWLFGAGILMLLLTMIPGLAHKSGGASRWIRIGPIGFQPVEFVKVAFVLFMAGYFSRHEEKIESFGFGVARPLVYVSFVAFLLLLQPDFGSSVIIALVTLLMATASGVRLRYILFSLVGLGLAMGALILVSPYRMARLFSFMSPMADAAGKGYQLIQSLIAVATGGITGVGLGGSQQKLFFLPAAHTDFIFAVVAEELGFIGGLGIILAFGVICWRGLRVSARLSGDTFSFSLAVGLTLLIVLPALVNIAVVLGLLPTKGLVLPLVGYGRSSLIMSLIAVGILMGLARSSKTASQF